MAASINAIDSFSIADNPTEIESFNGMICRITIESDKISYVIEDETGQMTAIHWYQQENVKVSNNIQIGKCYNIIGYPRELLGIGRYLCILKIEAAKKIADVFSHAVKVIDYTALNEKNDPLEEYRQGDHNLIYGEYRKIAITVNESIVLDIIREAPERYNVGINKNDLFAKLPECFTIDKLDQILKDLTSGEYIYSTIDEDHFISS